MKHDITMKKNSMQNRWMCKSTRILKHFPHHSMVRSFSNVHLASSHIGETPMYQDEVITNLCSLLIECILLLLFPSISLLEFVQEVTENIGIWSHCCRILGAPTTVLNHTVAFTLIISSNKSVAAQSPITTVLRRTSLSFYFPHANTMTRIR